MKLLYRGDFAGKGGRGGPLFRELNPHQPLWFLSWCPRQGMPGSVPPPPQSLEGDTLMGITYTALTPFLSPIIFSLRNKELKEAVKKTFLSKL